MSWTESPVASSALLALAVVAFACEPRGDTGSPSTGPEEDAAPPIRDVGTGEEPGARSDASPPVSDTQAQRPAADAGAAPSYSGGAVVFSEVEHDFGDVYPNRVLEHLFKLRNEGQEVLRIESVAAS